MKIKTTRFGEIDIDESRILTFTEGLLGFPEYKKYIVLDHDTNSPFKWLQSIECPQLAFVIIDPLYCIEDYTIDVNSRDISDLALSSIEDAIAFCIVTIKGGCKEITANLMGPVVVNPEKMLAKQIVLANSSYSIKHPLISQNKKKSVQDIAAGKKSKSL